MTPELAVIERLRQITAVTTLVGNRIYALVLAQHSVLPAIRVQVIDEITDYHTRGGDRVKRARVQVDGWADATSGTDPYAAAITLAEAINGNDAGSGLSGWRGSFGSPSFDVLGIFRIDRDVSWESDERREVRVRQDFQVHFKA